MRTWGKAAVPAIEEEYALKKWKKRLFGILGRMDSQEEQERAGTELSAFAEGIEARLQALEKAQGRHDRVVEDMLDSWGEWQEALHSETGSLRETAQMLQKKELAAAREREERLLSLAMEAQDQLFALNRAASEDKAWQEQLAMVQEKMHLLQQEAELECIGREGEPFDYECHEALSVIPARSREEDMRICEVMSPGFRYQGRVIRKARVSVWQNQEENK